jgi:DNA-directed RNA polymerase III subunit RPC6
MIKCLQLTVPEGSFCNLNLRFKVGLPPEAVYNIIIEAGNKGLWMLDILKKLLMAPNIATKVVRTLVASGLLKEVSDVRHRSRKIFMATDFQSFAEITGGTWYHDGRLDTDAVSTARRCCQAQVERLGAATAQMIHQGILKEDPRAGYTIDKVKDIIKTMVLEEVKSTGTRDFSAVMAGTMCYRLVTGAPQGGMMEGIHCGICPRTHECSPEGIISPSTCVYYKKWLQMDF